MTIKELKNNLLKSLYTRYKDNRVGAIQLTKLCTEDKLIYDSLSQLSSAAESLKDSGYINATFFEGGDAIVMSLTANGIEYVEENLLSQEDLVIDGLNDTSKEFENSSLSIYDNADSEHILENHSKGKGDYARVFTPEENVKSIKDTDIEPCFSIKKVVNCFINQLDKIAETKTENIPMIGVFAPWGRGKSYFLNLVFQQLEARKDKWYHKLCCRNKTKAQTYKIIKFNAWKYQDTPALWAYLYETIYQSTSWWQKCWLYVKKNIFSFKCLLFIILLLFSWLIGYVLKTYTSILSAVSNLEAIGGIGTAITIVFSFVLTLRDNPMSALKIIQKYTKRNSYSDCLGIQNAIESDLEALLRVLIFRKDRVILCIDDIDRCSIEKMVNIVDSLRTVLENEEIRNKLIVICSIDIEKLMTGYQIVYKDFTSDSVIREQIDKVFIFSLGLAKLGTIQLKEYLHKLISITDSDDREVISETLLDVSRTEGSLYATNPKEKPIKLSDLEMYNAISAFVAKNNSVNITPRKIRIMYYQLLFANNLASCQGVILTEQLIEDLLNKSLTGIDNNIGNKALGDIIEMAVPY